MSPRLQGCDVHEGPAPEQLLLNGPMSVSEYMCWTSLLHFSEDGSVLPVGTCVGYTGSIQPCPAETTIGKNAETAWD